MRQMLEQAAAQPSFRLVELDLLRDDERAIFRAASLASKAADFLLAFRAEGTETGAGRAA